MINAQLCVGGVAPPAAAIFLLHGSTDQYSAVQVLGAKLCIKSVDGHGDSFKFLSFFVLKNKQKPFSPKNGIAETQHGPEGANIVSL